MANRVPENIAITRLFSIGERIATTSLRTGLAMTCVLGKLFDKQKFEILWGLLDIFVLWGIIVCRLLEVR